MNENTARETIKKILQDLSLKARKRGIIVKIIYPDARTTPRNYMLILLTKGTCLYGSILVDVFVIGLDKEPNNWTRISKNSYITKPTMTEYFEMSSLYRAYKNKPL